MTVFFGGSCGATSAMRICLSCTPGLRRVASFTLCGAGTTVFVLTSTF